MFTWQLTTVFNSLPWRAKIFFWPLCALYALYALCALCVPCVLYEHGTSKCAFVKGDWLCAAGLFPLRMGLLHCLCGVLKPLFILVLAPSENQVGMI